MGIPEPAMSHEKAVTSFLNVDLDLCGRTGDIDEILRSMEPSVIVLHRAEQFAVVEQLRESLPSLEETVTGWVELVEALPPQVRKVWDALEFRKLNIGIQAECEPRHAEFAVSGRAVASLAAAHLEIIITVYAPPAVSPAASTAAS